VLLLSIQEDFASLNVDWNNSTVEEGDVDAANEASMQTHDFDQIDLPGRLLIRLTQVGGNGGNMQVVCGRSLS